MGWFDKIVKEITRPVKKVFKTETNRVIGDIKGEVTRSPELRVALELGGTLVGVPPGVTSLGVSKLIRPEEVPPGLVSHDVGVDNIRIQEPAAPESDVESWAWTSKYLQTQRQVARAKAIEQPSTTAEGLAIEEIALPAAGIGLAWWLLS